DMALLVPLFSIILLSSAGSAELIPDLIRILEITTAPVFQIPVIGSVLNRTHESLKAMVRETPIQDLIDRLRGVTPLP
ncbi:hypothetical protein PMAYCL1PPCAC_20679, partial [Pristionchus mayeri]